MHENTSRLDVGIMAGLGGCLGSDPTNVFQYSEAQMEKRVRRLEGDLKRNRRLDIFVTHAPLLGVGDGKDEFHRGFACFREVHRLNTPALHLFGHRHLSGNPVNKDAVYRSGEVTLINCTGYRIIDTDEFALPRRKQEAGQRPMRTPRFRHGRDING